MAGEGVWTLSTPAVTYLFICLPGNLPACLFSGLLFIYLPIYLSVCLFIYHLSLYVRAAHSPPSLAHLPTESKRVCSLAGPSPSSCSRDSPAGWSQGGRDTGFQESFHLVAKLSSSITTVVGAHSPLLSSLGKCLLSTYTCQVLRLGPHVWSKAAKVPEKMSFRSEPSAQTLEPFTHERSQALRGWAAQPVRGTATSDPARGPPCWSVWFPNPLLMDSFAQRAWEGDGRQGRGTGTCLSCWEVQGHALHQLLISSLSRVIL